MVSTPSRRRHTSRISAPVITWPSAITGALPLGESVAVVGVVVEVVIRWFLRKQKIPASAARCRWDEGFPPRYHPAWSGPPTAHPSPAPAGFGETQNERPTRRRCYRAPLRPGLLTRVVVVHSGGLTLPPPGHRRGSDCSEASSGLRGSPAFTIPARWAPLR